MNWKKFFIAFIAAFIFLFVFGFLWYGKFMDPIHKEVPMLWRTQADFGSHFPWLVLGHIVVAFFLTMLYAHFVPAGGAGAGFSLGILLALLFVGNNVIVFVVQALVIFAFVMIYASGFAGGGVIAGIRLGIVLEIAAIGMRLAIYAVQPFPGKLIVYGSISGLIEMIIVGAIVAAIYKPAPARMST